MGFLKINDVANLLNETTEEISVCKEHILTHNLNPAKKKKKIVFSITFLKLYDCTCSVKPYIRGHILENYSKYCDEWLRSINLSYKNIHHSSIEAYTYYISNSTAISEPPIRQSIPKINTIIRQVRLSKAPTQIPVVPDVGERIAEDELHNLAMATVNGNTKDTHERYC